MIYFCSLSCYTLKSFTPLSIKLEQHPGVICLISRICINIHKSRSELVRRTMPDCWQRPQRKRWVIRLHISVFTLPLDYIRLHISVFTLTLDYIRLHISVFTLTLNYIRLHISVFILPLDYIRLHISVSTLPIFAINIVMKHSKSSRCQLNKKSLKIPKG